MTNDTYKTAVIARPLYGLLLCQEREGRHVVCQGLGREPSREYGGSVRRFVLSSLQAAAVEVLHHRLSEEARDIRSDVPRPHRASSVLQLGTPALRAYLHTGFVLLCTWTRNTLWHTTRNGLLQKGVTKLADTLLRAPSRHSRVFHAHCPSSAAGDRTGIAPQDVYAQGGQGCGSMRTGKGTLADVERCARLRFDILADRGHCTARPVRELCRGWLTGQLDWSRPSQVDAQPARMSRTANRQPDVATVLKCLHEHIRPVHEARTPLQVLWPLCGRLYRCFLRQGMAAVVSTAHQGVPEEGAWSGIAHGKTAGFRSASWRRVPGLFYQALQNIRLESYAGTHTQEPELTDESAANKDRCQGYASSELPSWQKNFANKTATFRQQLPRHYVAHRLLQSASRTVLQKGIYASRRIQWRHDKINRQT